ncbi:ComEC/Rec2 family competence protein [Clostridium carnis]
MKRITKIKKIILINIFIMLIFFIGCSDKNIKLDNLNVYFFQVGKADSILIKNNKFNILIDTGTDKDGENILLRLKELNIDKLDYLILTHPDKDHIGGADIIVNNLEVEKVISSYEWYDSKQFKELQDAMKNKNITIHVPSVEEEIILKDISIRFIGPLREYVDENNNSLILQLKHGKNSFLFTGDAKENSLMDLIGKNRDIKSDVLKVPHHGRGNKASGLFFNKVKPKISIITCDKNNEKGLPEEKVIRDLESIKSKVFITGNGEINIISNGIDIDISQ